MSYVKGFLLTIFLVFSSPYESFPNSSNTFNQLILTKSFLEAKHGLRSIECFPFKENIGFTENQIPLIDNCLKGVNFLASVLVELNHPEVNMIGISNRFLRTGGFNNLT